MHLDFACLDAATRERSANSLNVVHDDLKSFLGSRSHLGHAYSHHYRACRSRRRELHEAQLVVDPVIVVQMKSNLVDVEGLGAIDVGHGHRNELEFHVHAPNLVAHPESLRDGVSRCVSGSLRTFPPRQDFLQLGQYHSPRSRETEDGCAGDSPRRLLDCGATRLQH
jgi:hypothetical protein